MSQLQDYICVSGTGVMHSFQIHLIFSALSIWARLITNVHPPLLTPGKGCELLRLFSCGTSPPVVEKNIIYISRLPFMTLLMGLGLFQLLFWLLEATCQGADILPVRLSGQTLST